MSGSGNWSRCPETGTLININNEEIDRAKQAKQNRKKEKDEVQQLKNEVGEIKELLNKLIEKL